MFILPNYLGGVYRQRRLVGTVVQLQAISWRLGTFNISHQPIQIGQINARNGRTCSMSEKNEDSNEREIGN